MLKEASVLSEKGDSVDSKKIKTVIRWPVSNDKIEVGCFMRLATYMRKYVRNFAKITAPITDLLKEKFERITWTNDCHASFEALKKALTKTLVLRMMDPLKDKLVLCTNASNIAIGDILMQEGRVIAYVSKKLSNAELNYPVEENNC